MRLVHTVTKHAYTLTVYYAPQVKKISKPQMVDIVKNFSQVSVILTLLTRDKMMNSVGEGFLSETAMVDPFRVHSPKRRIYSFVSNAGKSRGDRVYVNEESVTNISNHKYSLTPFNNAHKIISFTLTDQQERGRGYWKLNSSVLNDNAYVAMVRQTIVNVDELNILDKQRWWDIFLTCIRYKDRISSSQAGHYNFLKGKLRHFEEKLVAGYRQRTRGLPAYEQSEPDIAFYAKLEKRSA